MKCCRCGMEIGEEIIVCYRCAPMDRVASALVMLLNLAKECRAKNGDLPESFERHCAVTIEMEADMIVCELNLEEWIK